MLPSPRHPNSWLLRRQESQRDYTVTLEDYYSRPATCCTCLHCSATTRIKAGSITILLPGINRVASDDDVVNASVGGGNGVGKRECSPCNVLSTRRPDGLGGLGHHCQGAGPVPAGVPGLPQTCFRQLLGLLLSGRGRAGLSRVSSLMLGQPRLQLASHVTPSRRNEPANSVPSAADDTPMNVISPGGA